MNTHSWVSVVVLGLSGWSELSGATWTVVDTGQTVCYGETKPIDPPRIG
jgi:hypothetical protein